MMKNSFKYKTKIALKRILIMFIIICNLFPMLFSGATYADENGTTPVDMNSVTIERLGNYVSNFGINFYKNWSSDSINTSDRNDIISEGAKGEIRTAYNDTATADGVKPETETYVFSNKSWIDFCYKNSLNLSDSSYYPLQNLSNKTYFEDLAEGYLEDLNLFVKEDDENKDNSDENIADIAELMNSGKVLPGDIIYTSEHEYLLYVGGTKVLYACPPIKDEGAIKYEFLQDYFVKIKRKYQETYNTDEEPVYGVLNIYRPTEEYRDAIGVQENDLNLMYNKKGYYDINTKYNGIAKGSYTGSTHTSLIGLIIKFLIDAVSWIINYTLFLVRSVILGWVSIIESAIQMFMLKLSGHSSKVSYTDYVNGISATSYSGTRVTVESLFYNQVPITDANFFNFESAGGYSLMDKNGNPTVLYNLRKAVAEGYVIIRNVSIAITLFVLIYMGIRMALSSLAERKAQYKQQLISWVTALGIIMFIHFFMYAIFFINDVLLDIIKGLAADSVQGILGVSTGELSLYDAIRTKAYSFDYVDGTIGVIFYIILIYFLIRFSLIYLKRMLTTYLLAMMGTVMGVKYAFDKANGRRSTSLSKWMRDYSYNILLQSIHALIYTVLMTIALKVSLTSFTGIVIAVVVLRFLLEADKIFIKIFGVSSKGGLFEDTNKPESYLTFFRNAKLLAHVLYAPVTAVANVFNMENGLPRYLAYLKHYENGDTVNDVEKKIAKQRFDRIGKEVEFIDSIDRVNFKPIHFLTTKVRSSKWYKRRAVFNTDASYEFKKNEYAYINAVKKLKKRRFTRRIGYVKKFALGTAQIVASLGITTDSFDAGAHTLMSGVSTLRSGVDRKTARRYRSLQIPGSAESRLPLFEIDRLRKIEKEEKELKGIIGKQVALENMAQEEIEINRVVQQLIDERDRELAACATDEERERLKADRNEEIKNTIRRTTKTQISAYTIRKAVDSYLYKNDKTTIEPDDLDGILDELQDVLDDRTGNKIEIDEDTRSRLMTVIGNVNDLAGKDRKQAAAYIEEKISAPGVIQIEDVQTIQVERAIEYAIADSKMRKGDIKDIMAGLSSDIEDLTNRIKSDLTNMDSADIPGVNISSISFKVDNTTLEIWGNDIKGMSREDATEYITQKLHEYIIEKLKKENINSSIIEGRLHIDNDHKAIEKGKVQKSLTISKNKKDLSVILNKLQKILDKENSDGIQLDAETRDRLKSVLSSDLSELETADVEELAQTLRSKLIEPGVIKNDKKKFSEDSGRQAALEQVAGKLQKIRGINNTSVLTNKGVAVAYNKIVKEILKKL